MDKMMRLLKAELGYLPEGGGLEKLLEQRETLYLRNKEPIIEAGTNNSNVYFLRSGIIRFCDMDGDKERTFSFGLPGTMFMSKYSFFRDLPSYYQVEACCDCIVYSVTKERYWEMVNSDPQLAIWMLKYAQLELFFQEYKHSNIHNGSAKDRFRAFLDDRPELIRKVSQKVLASYLGVTPEYFSYLKRKFFILKDLE